VPRREARKTKRSKELCEKTLKGEHQEPSSSSGIDGLNKAREEVAESAATSKAVPPAVTTGGDLLEHETPVFPNNPELSGSGTLVIPKAKAAVVVFSQTGIVLRKPDQRVKLLGKVGL